MVTSEERYGDQHSLPLDPRHNILPESAEPHSDCIAKEWNELRDQGRSSNRVGSLMKGIIGCIRPVLTMMSERKQLTQGEQCDWELVFDEITDLKWLGSGAQGAVFQGFYDNHAVAVKKMREYCETNMEHLKKLNHPNVVQFIGVCNEPPYFCIIMEYCSHGSLHDHLKNGRALNPTRLSQWSQHVAEGMNYLHTNRIIHRDLKSPNILIGDGQILKISDFGTSREWNDISMRMSFAGTVAWMAPEIIRNEPCSEKVDIWSYGVVLWEMLTSDTPYKNVDSSAIIWGVGNDSLHLPIPKDTPIGLKLLMQQCWGLEPKNRPSFRNIISHLTVASQEINCIPSDVFSRKQIEWQQEVRACMEALCCQSFSEHEEDLIQKRREELQHAQEIRKLYERKLEEANNLYIELNTRIMRIENEHRVLNDRGNGRSHTNNGLKPFQAVSDPFLGENLVVIEKKAFDTRTLSEGDSKIHPAHSSGIFRNRMQENRITITSKKENKHMKSKGLHIIRSQPAVKMNGEQERIFHTNHKFARRPESFSSSPSMASSEQQLEQCDINPSMQKMSHPVRVHSHRSTNSSSDEAECFRGSNVGVYQHRQKQGRENVTAEIEGLRSILTDESSSQWSSNYISSSNSDVNQDDTANKSNEKWSSASNKKSEGKQRECIKHNDKILQKNETERRGDLQKYGDPMERLFILEKESNDHIYSNG